MINEIQIQEGFEVLKIVNESNKALRFTQDVKKTMIQMHFCLNGEGILYFGPTYNIKLIENYSMLLYNPEKDLPINLEINPRGKYVVFLFTINMFHSFFSQVADLIPFLNDENKDKRYYLDKKLTPSEILVLNQIVDEQRHNSMQKLYLKAKIYETLCLYFGSNQDNKQQCPFLDSEENVDKIKQVKKILINNMTEPPTLQTLANEVGLTLPKLKEGFKHIYGEPVFIFLLDYKLEYARKQLLSKQYNVSEISSQVGYSTASHFISAFKKKYGTTPKKYLMSMS